jgi:hypothetical protein
METDLLKDWTRDSVSCIRVDTVAVPRIEIGDIRRGPGSVVTFEQGYFLARGRAFQGGPLEGPYRLDPSERHLLLSLLTLRLQNGPCPADLTAFKVLTGLLRAEDDLNAPAAPARAGTASPSGLSWDEAHADVC